MNHDRNYGARLCAAAAAMAVLAPAGAWAQQQVAQNAAPPPIRTAGGEDVHEVAAVVVNGVPYRETVLPTRMATSSVYGLDLSVMDTPRNTTLDSTWLGEAHGLLVPDVFDVVDAALK